MFKALWELSPVEVKKVVEAVLEKADLPAKDYESLPGNLMAQVRELIFGLLHYDWGFDTSPVRLEDGTMDEETVQRLAGRLAGDIARKIKQIFVKAGCTPSAQSTSGEWTHIPPDTDHLMFAPGSEGIRWCVRPVGAVA